MELATRVLGDSSVCLARRRGHASTAIGSLWIGFWTAEPIDADCRSAVSSITALHRTYDRPVSVLAVVGRGLRSAFGAEARAACTRSSAAIRAMMGHGAVVIEHEGVIASIIASAATGIMMLARVTSVRVFLDPAAGATWIGAHAYLDGAHVQRTVEHLRACAEGP